MQERVMDRISSLVNRSMSDPGKPPFSGIWAGAGKLTVAISDETGKDHYFAIKAEPLEGEPNLPGRAACAAKTCCCATKDRGESADGAAAGTPAQ